VKPGSTAVSPVNILPKNPSFVQTGKIYPPVGKKSDAMKNYLKSWTSLLLAAFLAPALLSANHQDYYGLPGDDFSLEGALDLFKSCNSLEDFERELNASDNNINNLDLNHNGRIDYLRVVDHAEGDLHAIVIQALIDNGISQDVAVIEVKRNRYGEAVVQIVGDEDLYGTAKIVEPYPYDDVVGTDYYNDYYDHYSSTVFVNAWAWPSVRFIFAPRYVVWVSPYYYDYYPVWYSYWSPRPYHVWQSRPVVYHHHYCVAPSYRIPEAHHYYGARRVSAPVVHQRTETYVAQHGGRANFDYTKRQDKVDAPRTRSLDRPENAATATRTDRPREKSPKDRKLDPAPRTSSQPAKNQNTDRSRQPEPATVPNSRQREPKPQTDMPQPSKPTAPSRHEQSPKAQSPRSQNRNQDAAPARPSTERSSRQSAAPSRDMAPRANASNSRSAAKSSTPAQARPQPQPKADRAAEPNSRASTPNKPAGKVERSSQPRKGQG
jgi:hypothetical protein